MIDEDTIPETLRTRTQWICWRSEERGDKPTKVPIDPRSGNFASSTDDRTWSDFEGALEYLRSGNADGIGFVFSANDPVVGVDLDYCRDSETGRPEPDAKAIIKQLDSYTEVSPSGTGYHVLVCGELPEGRNRRGQIEIYDHARFFTVTGDRVPGTPTKLHERQEKLEAIHEEYVQDTWSNGDEAHSASSTRNSTTAATLSNDEILEKATTASNGAKFERLWNGNILGYESQSEADMALCCLLAFWTGGRESQLDDLFRKSALYREKWDEVHYADGSTYGEKTVVRAIDQVSEFYEPPETERTPVRSTSAPENEPTAVPGDRTQRYLEEKNRILSERVTELERLLEEKHERIQSLEATLTRVRSDTVQQQPSIPERNRSLSTVWRRITRLFSR